MNSDIKHINAPETTALIPIPLLLWCPGVTRTDGKLVVCGARHIDRGEFATKVHHTHSCQTCGLSWRPAVVPTVGVEFLPGFKDALINEPAGDVDTKTTLASRVEADVEVMRLARQLREQEVDTAVRSVLPWSSKLGGGIHEFAADVGAKMISGSVTPTTSEVHESLARLGAICNDREWKLSDDASREREERIDASLLARIKTDPCINRSSVHLCVCNDVRGTVTDTELNAAIVRIGAVLEDHVWRVRTCAYCGKPSSSTKWIHRNGPSIENDGGAKADLCNSCGLGIDPTFEEIWIKIAQTGRYAEERVKRESIDKYASDNTIRNGRIDTTVRDLLPWHGDIESLSAQIDIALGHFGDVRAVTTGESCRSLVRVGAIKQDHTWLIITSATERVTITADDVFPKDWVVVHVGNDEPFMSNIGMGWTHDIEKAERFNRTIAESYNCKYNGHRAAHVSQAIEVAANGFTAGESIVRAYYGANKDRLNEFDLDITFRIDAKIVEIVSEWKEALRLKHEKLYNEQKAHASTKRDLAADRLEIERHRKERKSTVNLLDETIDERDEARKERDSFAVKIDELNRVVNNLTRSESIARYAIKSLESEIESEAKSAGIDKGGSLSQLHALGKLARSAEDSIHASIEALKSKLDNIVGIK